MTRDEELAAIEAALDRLLSEIVERRLADGRRPRPPLVLAEFASTGFSGPPPTPAESFVLDLAKDPIRVSLEASIRTLGEALYEIGGNALMETTSDRVCDMDQAKWQRRASILSHRWDGIGSWYA